MNPSKSPQRITVRKTGNEVYIKIKGQFTHMLRQEFREAYYGCPTSHHYVVDLGEVTIIDSSAMGMLVVLRSYAGGDDADLTLKNASLKLIGLFKVASLYDLFWH